MNISASNSIKVMLVEDNPEYRAVVELAFADEDDIELICQFGTSEIAIRSLSEAGKKNIPDLMRSQNSARSFLI